VPPDRPVRYSLDTSALLNAWRRNYPPDLFPTLWDNIDGLVASGTLIASEEVLIELEKKDDEVFAWAEQHANMFIPIDGQIQQLVCTILQSYPRLIDNRTNRSGADPFVIALAILEKCTVVTNEHATSNQAKPNIPDVCSGIGVRCISMVELIREQSWRI
jgi:hypothetical protein